MTDIVQITTGVSNATIESIVPTVDTKLQGVDAKIADLLDLVEKYEELTNGKFRRNFIDGCLNISRSNYHGGQLFKKYGPDAFDMREYLALTTITTTKHGQFGVVNGLEVVRAEKKIASLKKRREREVKDGNSKTSDEKPNKADVVDEKSNIKEMETPKEESKIVIIAEESTSTGKSLAETSGIKNRKANSASNSEKKLTKPVTKDTTISTKQSDPIDQFGALVPPLLYEAQKKFEEWIKSSVEVVNIQKAIVDLVSEIERDLHHGN